MQFANLDMIAKRILLERGLPIHYYIEVIFHCASAVRWLNQDTLKMINVANIPVNDYYAIDLPSDFQDDIGLYYSAGATLQQLPKRYDLNPLRVNNVDTGEFEPQVNPTRDQNGELTFGFDGAAFWFWNISDYGEPTGRFFGASGGTTSGYRVFKERRQIQLADRSDADSVILVYISNGRSADNATTIDWAAFRAISTYTDWQMSANATDDRSPEARTWWNARRHLRANLSDLTKTDILNIVRNSYKATIKN